MSTDYRDADYRGSEEVDQPFAPAKLGDIANILTSAWRARMAYEGACESPIEYDLMEALIALGELVFDVRPQVTLGRFRYDFGISRIGCEKLLALVECDGRDFHRTAEQQANDDAKDALARHYGLRLFRFTGSEIYRERFACAQKVVRTLIADVGD